MPPVSQRFPHRYHHGHPHIDRVRSSSVSALLQSATLTVVPWRDPVVERLGHDACGDYVELFWLGSLGPTATWLLRRLAVAVVTHPEGTVINLADLALGLGLGPDTGPTGSFGRSLGRLVMFGLARIDHDHLAVRSIVPPVPYKQVARLPNHLQMAHAQWSDESPHRALAAAYGTV
ncbi:MAG: hypothetical protein ACKO84_03515 [Actinomycetota bacterium]